MKRLIVLLLLAVAVLPALAKGDWKGKVVDEKGEPVAYANVAVLSKADSTVVCGVVTQEDGSFNIVTNETDGIMEALYEIGFDGPIRPDHGRMIWGEKAMPGYGLYDRALGATYLQGLWEACEKTIDRSNVKLYR